MVFRGEIVHLVFRERDCSLSFSGEIVHLDLRGRLFTGFLGGRFFTWFLKGREIVNLVFRGEIVLGF